MVYSKINTLNFVKNQLINKKFNCSNIKNLKSLKLLDTNKIQSNNYVLN